MGSDESPKKSKHQMTFTNQNQSNISKGNQNISAQRNQNTTAKENQYITPKENQNIVNNNLIKTDIHENKYNYEKKVIDDNKFYLEKKDYSEKNYYSEENQNIVNKVSTRNYTSKYNENELINRLKESLENYSLKESIYKLEISNDDPIFNKINEKISQILFEYLKKNKNYFSNSISNFLNLKPLNVGTHIISSLIQSEDGYSIYERKVMNEIAKINENKNHSEIKNLSVLLIGKSGVGKSALINCMLRLEGNDKAPENTVDIGTLETKDYHSNNVPFLRLIDTRGIELNYEYGAEALTKECKKYIETQLGTNDMNNFVHCIWYCITGSKIEKVEIESIDKIKESYKISNIPIIIVYTQSTDVNLVEKTRKYVEKNSIGNDFVSILAREKELPGGNSLPPFGLDKLLEKTIKECKKALNGDMHLVMTKKIDEDIKNNLKNENSKIRQYINEENILDFIKEYNITNKEEFQNYLINLYGKTVNYFLDKDLSNEGKNIINNSNLINSHSNEYINNYMCVLKEMILKDLESLSINGLIIQASIEKKNQTNIKIENRKDLEDFKKYNKKYLFDCFSNLAQKYYISYILQNTSKNFSFSFEQELNKIVIDILNNPKIKKQISFLFQQRFKDFEKKILQKHFISNITEIDENQIYNNNQVNGNPDIYRKRENTKENISIIKNNLEKQSTKNEEKDIIKANFDMNKYDLNSINTNKLSSNNGTIYSNLNNNKMFKSQYQMNYKSQNRIKEYSDIETVTTIDLNKMSNKSKYIDNNNLNIGLKQYKVVNNQNKQKNPINPNYYSKNIITNNHHYDKTTRNSVNNNLYYQHMNYVNQKNININNNHNVKIRNNIRYNNPHNYQNLNYANHGNIDTNNIHYDKIYVKNNNNLSYYHNMNYMNQGHRLTHTNKNY